MPKIFQIGFNRCGTKSLFHFFRKNGLKSIHWAFGSLAAGIEAANIEGKPLLTYIEGFDVYCDMEFMREDHAGEWITKRPFERFFANCPDEKLEKPIYAFERFKELDQQYPRSRFILNKRDPDHWVRSRKNFLNSGYYFCKHGDGFHHNQQELDDCWLDHLHSHHESVREYFSNRPESLLEFDIENDSPIKLTQFFADLKLEPDHWSHHNQGDLSKVDFSETEWLPFSGN